MVVLKFGGTSVRDAVWMDKALDIAAKELPRAPVVVSSAMTKVTDKLQAIALHAEKGETDKATALIQELKDHHFTESKKFITGKRLEDCLSKLESHFKSLESITRGLCMLREKTPRCNDALLAFGELLSTIILASRAEERGIQTEFVDAREMVITDDDFTKAAPLFDITNQKITDRIKPAVNKLYITQGFIGSTKDGITTTLGRGGSDYSATIIGAALKAAEVQIWTDVDGIMTSDPRVVGKAFTIPSISYREAAELAYFGAKVVHPATIQPAVNLGIPVLVLNTGNPEHKGTTICANPDNAGAHFTTGLKAIASKKNITLLNVTSSRMLLAYGFLRKIFEIFEKYKTSVDLISTSEVSVSMTIDQSSSLKEINDELSRVGIVAVEEAKSIVCLVGQDIFKDAAFISRVFKALESISVRMISLGASDTNLSLVVDTGKGEQAVKLLHQEFFGA